MKNKIDKEINKKELNEVISLSKKILKVLYIVFIACLILFGIVALQKLNILKTILEFMGVISPFFIGFILAWLLRPLVLKLNTKIKNNTLSSMIVFLVFIAIIFFLLYIFIPTIYNEGNEIVGLIPGFVEKITSSIKEIFTNLEIRGLALGDFQNKLLTTISNYGADIVKELPNILINFIVALFIGIGSFAMGLIICL